MVMAIPYQLWMTWKEYLAGSTRAAERARSWRRRRRERGDEGGDSNLQRKGGEGGGSATGAPVVRPAAAASNPNAGGLFLSHTWTRRRPVRAPAGKEDVE